MVEFYLPTSVPNLNKAQIKVIALRAARKMCIKQLLRKMRKYGKVVTEVTLVDEAIREDRRQ